MREERGLRQALEAWSRRRWLGALAFLVVAVPALSFVAFLPDIYKASATILVERQQVPESLVRPAVTDELETRLNAISEEILSRSNLEALITRFDLYPSLKAAATPPEGLVQRMRRDIEIDLKGVDRTWGRGTTVAFGLSFRGRDPARVADVANALAGDYVSKNLESRERQAAQTAEFLKSRLEDMKGKLAEQEGRIGTFKKRHAGELPQQVEANIAGLQRLNAQLQLNSENQIRAMERRDKLARQVGDTAGPAAGGDPSETGARLDRLKEELLALRRQYHDGYPDVVRLEKQIATLESRKAEPAGTPDPGGARDAAADLSPMGKALRDTETEIGSLRSDEGRLRETIASLEKRVDNAPQRQQEFDELSRDYETTRELYDSLLKKYEESLLSESMEHGKATEQFRILDAAVAPTDPSAPNRLWASLFALLVAIGAAAGAMALAEQLDTAFHSVDSLRAFTRVPVLATIPRIVTRGDAIRRLLRAGLVTAATAIVLAAAAGVSYVAAHRYEQVVYMLSGGRL